MSYTLTETGKILTETQEGITMPADYSFATVNDYVHGMEVHFEDLQALCLGMADHIDKMRRCWKFAETADMPRLTANAVGEATGAALCDRSPRP